MKILYSTLIAILFSCGTLWAQEWETNGNNINNTNTGNVGIGTILPENDLHVKGSFYLQGTQDIGGWKQSYFHWVGHSLVMGSKPGAYAHNHLELKPGGSNVGNIVSVFKMYTAPSENVNELKVQINSAGHTFFNGGNIGIGTTNPEALLHVDNNKNGLARYIFQNSNTGQARYVDLKLGTGNSNEALYIGQDQSPGGYGAYIDNRTNQNFNYKIQGTTKFTINSSGNVGIGTTNPDAKLTVKGDIHTQEVKVDLNGAVAPDFVFEPDYNLRTLAETEKYIKENKHLPEIPSATEMEQNGLELKAMNLKLLQKIEELTLYTIEQQKLIETQQKQLQSLQKQVNELKQTKN